MMVDGRMFLINNLYFFEFSVMSDMIDESIIWHQSYGHLHFNAMKLLQKKIVQGLPSTSFEDQVYKGCIFGKQYRLPFPLGLAW